MKFKFAVACAAILMLSACTMHKVTDKQQLCDQAKRQQALYQSTPTIDSHDVTSGQKQQLEQSVQANCQ